MVTIEDIRSARERSRGAVHVTPLMESHTLAKWAGLKSLRLKCESFQKTGSFKARGALNALSRLSAEEKARGVITFSAGNHAQALAWAARHENVRCTVVMFAEASKSKAQATRDYGADVILHGTPAEAYERAMQIREEKDYVFVHPFDDDGVIAGTGAISLEVLEQCGSPPHTVVVPIGGGGLIAGMAVALRAVAPSVRIIGVEPEGAPAMRRSLDDGSAQRLPSVNTIADGLAAPFAGVRNYAIVKELVDEVVLVSDDEIKRAMAALMERCKLFIEPGAAAATAALLNARVPLVENQEVVAIVSGGNVDLERIKQLT